MKLKNLIILLLIKFLNLFTKKNEIEIQAPKILILSTTGLGDTLWAVPFLKEIKTHYPQSEISFLTTSLGGQILKNNPHIDTFFIYQKKSLIQLIKSLIKQKIQIVFHLHTSQRLVLPIASIIGAKKIIGYKKKTKGLDFLLSDCFFEEKVHEIEKRLKLLKFLNISAKISAPKYYFEKSLIKKKQDKVLKILLHPGAKDRYKVWPIDSYIMLAEMYIKTYQAKVFFSLGPADSHLKSTIFKSNKPFFIIKDKSITAFANDILSMDLVITNDTGPMHLSAAIGTNTIGIFSATDPKISGPVGLNASSIYYKKTCKPCLKRKCNEPFCFYQISPAKVFKISRSLLDK